MPLEYRNLFSINKLKYIKAKKPKKHCVLCSIACGDENIGSLFVAQGTLTAVCVNKYPYNSGHILLFPKRHITDYRELEKGEEDELSLMLKESLNILDDLYSPSGYNIGYNIGRFAGASISHLHMHVVPRYQNELGCIDIIGGAKILIEDPVKTMQALKKAFKDRGYNINREPAAL
jgi:ATP adenylyltransferase